MKIFTNHRYALITGIVLALVLSYVLRSCLMLVGSPELAPAGRMASIVPGRRASMFPEAKPPALSDDE